VAVGAAATVCVLLVAGATVAVAGEADVVDVEVSRLSKGVYRFDVTVRHADEGWDHYADAFEVLAPDGTVLGTRTLYHPHVDEQPFTRSLDGVEIPDDVAEVSVRARDSVHAYGGDEMNIPVPRE
jgi:hypothetical protein